MTELEKLQRRFPGTSATEIMREYARDVGNPYVIFSPANVPPKTEGTSGDLFKQPPPPATIPPKPKGD